MSKYSNGSSSKGVDLLDLRIYLVLESLHILLICDWLDMQELGNLDTAMSNHTGREMWLNMLV
jgi:hypothetical protein